MGHSLEGAGSSGHQLLREVEAVFFITLMAETVFHCCPTEDVKFPTDMKRPGLSSLRGSTVSSIEESGGAMARDFLMWEKQR